MLVNVLHPLGVILNDLFKRCNVPRVVKWISLPAAGGQKALHQTSIQTTLINEKYELQLCANTAIHIAVKSNHLT